MSKKYKSVFFLIVVLLSTTVYAQKIDTDSLLLKYSNMQNDTLKLKLICNDLDKLKTSKPNEVIAASTKMVALAEELRSDKYKASFLQIIGVSYSIKNNFVKAIEFLKQSLEIRLKYTDKKPISDCYTKIGRNYYLISEYDEAIKYHLKAIEIYKELNDKVGIAGTYSNIGAVYAARSDYFSSLDYFTKSFELFNQVNRKKEVAGAYNNIGYIYQLLADYPKALDYSLKSLKLKEELNDEHGIAGTLSNIGEIYLNLEELDKSLDFYERGLKMRIKISDKYGMGASYGNIAIVHRKRKKYDLALENLAKSIEIRQSINDKSGLANAYTNTGNTYMDLKDYTKAIEYLTKAVNINEELGNKEGVSSSKNSLANVYLQLNNLTKAEEEATQGLAIAKAIHSKENILYARLLLSEIFTKKNDHNTALNYYKEYISLRDSIYNQDKEKQITQKQMNFDFEKRDALAKAEFEKQKLLAQSEIEKKEILLQQNKQTLLLLEQENELKELGLQKSSAELKIKATEAENQKKAIDLLNKEKTLKNLEAQQREENLKTQRLISIFSIAAVLLTSILLFLAIRGYKQKQKANEIISKQKYEVEQQKELVEEKNKEILDSITYAKRLQEAILPPLKLVQKHLENSFILYKPKDIVAGDFYWFEPKDNLLLFAAADCTGHGVPGAMVSVVCSNALNRTVKEFGITEPGKILDKVRELVVETFEKSESEVKDGMDISLCALNLATNELFWSGANNPLWVVKKGITGIYDLDEYKADKQPIGKTESAISFNTQKIKLIPGQSFYVFTDGFADQFGGHGGKKYKSANFKKFLLSIQEKDMNEQRHLINNEFESWKGSLEQVDDVCVIGVRV